MNKSAPSAPPSYDEATTGPPYPLEPRHPTPTFNDPPYPREKATLMPQPQIGDTTFPPYATGRSPSPIIPVNVLLNAQNRPLNAPQSDIVPLNAPNSNARHVAYNNFRDLYRKISIVIAGLIVIAVFAAVFARFYY